MTQAYAREPHSKALQCERPMFQGLGIRSAAHVVQQRLLDLAIGPTFNGTPARLVRPWPVVSDESISCITTCQIHSSLLLELWGHHPTPALLAHVVQHVVESYESIREEVAPVDLHRLPAIRVHAILAEDLVLIKVHVLDDVDTLVL